MRPSRHWMFMEMAQTVSRRSTCNRANVGAVITDGRNVLTIGYNGPPSGQPHCNLHDCPNMLTQSCTRSVHAEVNALQQLTVDHPWGLSLYCTYSPCSHCWDLIRSAYAGFIDHVYFREFYPDQDHLMERGDINGQPIGLSRVLPSGEVIPW